MDACLEVSVDHVVEQGALARPRDAGHRGQSSERNVGVDAAKVVQRGAANLEPKRAGHPAQTRHGDALLPGEILPGERLGRRGDRARVYHPAAVLAGTRAELQHEVGLPDGRKVVLHDHHGVAGIAETAQEAQQAIGVPRVKADRGLVQHVERVHESGPERVRERDPLRLAAGEGPCLPVEREVAESDVAEKLQAVGELLQHQVGDLGLERAERETGDPFGDPVDRAARHVGDRMCADPDRQGIRVEPRSAALGAGLRQLVLPQEDPDVLLVALLFQILEEGKDPDVAALASVEQLAPHRGLELVPRLGGVGVEAPGPVEQHPAAGLVAGLGPGIDRALRQAPARIGNDQRLIVLQHGPEPVACRAGAARVVEGEQGRGDRRGRRVAGAAGGRAGESQAPRLEQHDGDTLALLERGRHRLRDASERARLAHQSVHHHEQLTCPRQVEPCRELIEVMGHPIGHDADEAERPQVLDHGGMGELGDRRQRKRDLDPAATRHGLLGGRLRRVPANRRAALPAEAAADPGPEQAEIVVDLGGGADGGAAGNGRVPLLDRDRGREALEPVHQRLGHAVEKLLGVGGQRLDVAALPLGVERVEGQGALARAARPGDHDERPVGQVDRDAPQIVLPGVDDADDGIDHRD